MPVKITYNGVTTEYTEGVKTLKCSGKKMKSDVVIEIPEEVTKPTLITFTHSTKTYQAEEGMTWEEFINSEYNTDSFFVKWVFTGDPYVSYSGTSSYVIALDNTPVKLTDVISSNTYYSYFISAGGGAN